MCSLINYFDDQGYKVTVLLKHQFRIDYHLNDSITIDFLNWGHGLVGRIRDCIRLRKRIKRGVVIAFLYSANRDALLLTAGNRNVSLILSERNDPSRIPEKYYQRLIRNIVYLFADKIVFQTRDAMKMFPKSVQNKGKIIMNPLTDEILNNEIMIDGKDLVTLSRLDEQKNLFFMIDVFYLISGKYSDSRLLIYGEGPLKKDLEIYIKRRRLEDRCFLKGYVKDVWKDEVKKCRAYLSTSNYEGVSNSIMEALSLGIPVVATDCPIGGTKMLIDNGINGFIVEMNNIDLFYDAVSKIMEDDSLAQRLHQNALCIREKFSIKKIGEEWEKLL